MLHFQYGCQFSISVLNAKELRATDWALPKRLLLRGAAIPIIQHGKSSAVFESTDSYISTDELSMAVDAVRLERPF